MGALRTMGEKVPLSDMDEARHLLWYYFVMACHSYHTKYSRGLCPYNSNLMEIWWYHVNGCTLTYRALIGGINVCATILFLSLLAGNTYNERNRKKTELRGDAVTLISPHFLELKCPVTDPKFLASRKAGSILNIDICLSLSLKCGYGICLKHFKERNNNNNKNKLKLC